MNESRSLLQVNSEFFRSIERLIFTEMIFHYNRVLIYMKIILEPSINGIIFCWKETYISNQITHENRSRIWYRIEFCELIDTQFVKCADDLSNILVFISSGWLRPVYTIDGKTSWKPVSIGMQFSPTQTENHLLFECPNGCGHKYKYRKGLQRHMQYECGVEKQFICVVCSRAFSRRDHLKTHLLYVHERTLESQKKKEIAYIQYF